MLGLAWRTSLYHRRAQRRPFSLPLHQSLSFKLFLLFFMSVLLLYGIAGSYVIVRFDHGFDAQMREQARTMGKLTQALYDQRGRALLDSARLIAAMPAVQDALTAGDRSRLIGVAFPLVSQMPGTTISFFDAQGQSLIPSWGPDFSGDVNRKGMIGLRWSLDGRATYSIEDPNSFGLALHGFAPIRWQGDVIGAVSVNEQFDQEFMERTKEATGYAATILAPDGTPLAWTRDPVQDVTIFQSSVPLQALVAIEHGHEFTSLMYIHGMPFGSYALPLRDPENKLVGIVAVTTSMSELEQARTSVRLAMMIAGILAFLSTIALAWLFSRSLTRPLHQLTTAATRVAGGTYDLPADVHTNDEIGVLAAAFDHMRERVGLASRALIEAKAHAEDERNLVNAILNSTHDGIIMFDAEQRFKVVNRRWEYLFGLQSQDLEGHDARSVAGLMRDHFAQPALFDRSTADLFAEPLHVLQREEFEQVRPARRVLRRYSAPVHAANGQVIGRVFAYQDVSREHQSDALKSALISTVSHELRLPLTSIKGYARTLLMDNPPWEAPERREFLQYIDEESDKLGEMVDNLLDVSKIEAGVLQVQWHDVLLPLVIRKVMDRQRELLSAHTVEVRLPQFFPVIEADSRRIEQVIRNLLENAVKHGNPAGMLTIVGAVEAERVCITISDDGPGIPQEYFDRVFERFFQIDRSLTRHAGGSGLGLSICRGIIEAHGGEIWVTRAAGTGGCAVTFSLPRRRPSALAGRFAGVQVVGGGEGQAAGA